MQLIQCSLCQLSCFPSGVQEDLTHSFLGPWKGFLQGSSGGAREQGSMPRGPEVEGNV